MGVAEGGAGGGLQLNISCLVGEAGLAWGDRGWRTGGGARRGSLGLVTLRGEGEMTGDEGGRVRLEGSFLLGSRVGENDGEGGASDWISWNLSCLILNWSSFSCLILTISLY